MVKSCPHKKLMCCEKDFACRLDNCVHKKVQTCVADINCQVADCPHKKSISCQCSKENKLPVLDFAFIRAQRLEIGEKCNYQMGQVDKKENRDQLKSIQRKGQSW